MRSRNSNLPEIDIKSSKLFVNFYFSIASDVAKNYSRR